MFSLPHRLKDRLTFLYPYLGRYKLRTKLPPMYLGEDFSVDAWKKRRAVLYSLFRDNVFGAFPAGCRTGFRYTIIKREQRKGYNFHRVRVTKDDFCANFDVFLPGGVENPFIIIHPILECYRSMYNPNDVDDYKTCMDSSTMPTGYLLSEGVGVVYYQVGDIAPDAPGSENAGLLKTLIKERTPASAKAIGAWALFASIIADYLFAAGIATYGGLGIAGHSRGGKTALWAAASDMRFTAVYSNNAGCTGDSLARNNGGETIADINKRFPYWFCDNYRQFDGNEDNMPFDFHQLIALIAPRYVYVASSLNDAWACPRNEFLALQSAAEVWESSFNMPGFLAENRPQVGRLYHDGSLGYHIKRGRHSMALEDWKNFIAFLKKKDLVRKLYSEEPEEESCESAEINATEESCANESKDCVGQDGNASAEQIADKQVAAEEPALAKGDFNEEPEATEVEQASEQSSEDALFAELADTELEPEEESAIALQTENDDDAILAQVDSTFNAENDAVLRSMLLGLDDEFGAMQSMLTISEEDLSDILNESEK